VIDVQLVKSYVIENLESIHTNSDVARAFGLPVDYLQKQFQRSEHIPLSRFITLMRVERAKELLRQEDMKCFEVCYAVGFKREDSGETTFKRLTGLTMGEYRDRKSSAPSLSVMNALSPLE